MTPRALPGASRVRPADVQVVPQLVVSTLLLGGIYALIAVGLTLIFGVMRVVNFAHGEFLMLAMYLAFWCFALLRLDPYVTLVLALPVICSIPGVSTTRPSAPIPRPSGGFRLW